MGLGTGWAELPRPLRAETERRLGARVVAVRPPATVHGSPFAGVLRLADGTSAFAKAADGDVVAGDLRVEAAVTPGLCPSVSTPAFRFAVERGPWVLLAFDAVHGRHPHLPWTALDARAVLEGYRVRAGLAAPARLRTLGELMAETRRFRAWRDTASQPADLRGAMGLHAAATRARLRIPDLAELEEGWLAGTCGSALVHFDPREDNHLIDGRGEAWLVDWSRACAAAPWVDVVTLLPALAADGHDVERLLREYAPRAPHDGVNAYLAALSGYWIEAGGQAGPIELVTYRRRAGTAALGWLARRLG